MKKIISIVIIFLIFLGFYIYKKPNDLNGFTKQEVEIINTLENSEKELFLSHQQLHSIFKESEFDTTKLADYIKLYQQKNLSNHFLVFIVNQKLENQIEQLMPFLKEQNCKEDHLKRYLAYQSKNPSLEIKKIISLVNEGIDSITMDYDDSIEDFRKDPYFLKEHLQRYIDYQNQYHTNATETVAFVNSNLDYEYYTNTQETDLSKGFLMIVNKYYTLPSDYIPENLVSIEAKYGKTLQMNQTAYEAFKQMADDAKEENLTLYITSPYRSFQTQKSLYQRYCNQDGQKLADTYSARAGYSEHQTGLAADIVSGPNQSLASFEDTKEFYWMKENAHKYGFILRYEEGKIKEKITGYQYEPWHYRYVGIEVATKMKELGITFDEYYAYYIK